MSAGSGHILKRFVQCVKIKLNSVLTHITYVYISSSEQRCSNPPNRNLIVTAFYCLDNELITFIKRDFLDSERKGKWPSSPSGTLIALIASVSRGHDVVHIYRMFVQT